MRVLITGGGGQVGTEVRLVCEAAGDEVLAPGHAELDTTDRDAVLSAITSVRPQVVIHTAARAGVDACEGDPAGSFASNALSVRWVAEACRRTGGHLVHLSTDYVFSGSQPDPYTEWDETGPLNVYGRSKLAGEREALEAGIGATIVRSSWIIGARQPNMLTRILELFGRDETLRFVDDQRGQPTIAADLAPMLRRMALDRRPGLHHITSQGPVTRLQFVREIAAAAGRDPEIVQPISSVDLDPQPPAARPANSVLDNAVLRLSGIPLLPDFRESLPAIVQEILGR
jgi:dTDP-4-dehydrorhamnose reductase